MRAKTLKHKTLPDTYGVPEFIEGRPELMHSSLPMLQPIHATIELMKQAYKEHHETGEFDNSIILEQLEDYNMVEVEITVIPQ